MSLPFRSIHSHLKKLVQSVVRVADAQDPRVGAEAQNGLAQLRANMRLAGAGRALDEGNALGEAHAQRLQIRAATVVGVLGHL